MMHERRRKIEELLNEKEVIKVSELVEMFDVSIETIRRDLEYMEEQELLKRVYGGAVLPQPKALEPSYESREDKNYKEKRAIGHAALQYVQDNDVIAIDIGTTTLEFAKALVGRRKVTVLTNSMKIAMVLSEDSNIRVLMLGGEVRYGDYSVSGFLTVNNMKGFNTEKLFLGIGGLSVSKGATDYHMEESNWRRVAIEGTQKVIVLADHSKIGVAAMNKVCPMSDLDVIITDSQADEQFVHRVRELGVEVKQVEVEE
ncbi:DeoR/GlpR family transcriptional regulator of sugar metabolism [Aequitasia blattaphilus]|uniref:DeoR/GlpR family DNA-binding transcription regulator n=1 Tax=Aequitasia blattaphilus TaxID=2949332 RepID=A0ABT1EC60_9FIRM|nr:DeoR/GlpR family DNA-binding transcription regulator [Aequitasia blattaphilus]MCP1103423.1 DeoR/GlpR family DNA-binding transcription regulator [Aequitasia blattaphilus]MCR8616063.1 DeoR/GlpR family DNA-binding transcription regulator [Aequitasia blattaphilus]